jgi:hypothetical protein
MKKVVFIVSHMGSGSYELLRIMNSNPRVLILQSGATYSNPSNLEWLFQENFLVQAGKENTAATIYGDHLLFNANLACTSLYDICKFIYFIRPAKPSLNELNLVKNIDFTPENACLYYCFRMRRICEMAKNTPGAVLLTWDDLADGRGFALIEEYLHLKTQLSPAFYDFVEKDVDVVPHELVEKAQDSYERYLYYLRHLDLKMVST